MPVTVKNVHLKENKFEQNILLEKPVNLPKILQSYVKIDKDKEQD